MVITIPTGPQARAPLTMRTTMSVDTPSIGPMLQTSLLETDGCPAATGTCSPNHKQ